MTVKQSSLTKQAAFLFAGNLAALLVTALVPMALVRLFPVEQYGLYQQVLLVFSTLFPIGQMGVTQGLYYFLPREPEKRDAVVSQTFIFVLLTGGCILIALLFFSEQLATAMNNPTLSDFIPVTAVFVFLMITSSFIETVLIAEGMAGLSSLVKVGGELLRSVVVIVAAFFSHSIMVVLWSLVFYAGVRCILQWGYLRSRYDLSLKNINFSFFKRQLGYALPIGAGNVAWLLQQRLHNFFVTFLFPVGAFAVYNIGTFNMTLFSVVTGAIANVTAPALALAQRDGDKERILHIWGQGMRKMNLLFFPTFVFLFIMADEFIIGLYTNQYVESIAIFRISLFALLIIGINTGPILSAFAESRFQLKIALMRLPVAIAVLYFFTKGWGMLGAVAADVFVSASFRFFVLGKVARVMKIEARELVLWSDNFKILSAAVLSGAPLFIVKELVQVHPLVLLSVTAPMFVLVYGLLGLALKIISWSEVSPLLRLFGPPMKTD
jgi:O-antigen/teichoic acid export membrane protein